MSEDKKIEASDFENVVSKEEMTTFWEIVLARAKGGQALLASVSSTAAEFAAAKRALAKGHEAAFFSFALEGSKPKDALIKGELFKSITTTKLNP